MADTLHKTLIVLLAIIALWVFGYAAFVISVLQIPVADENTITDAIVVLTGGDKRVETGLNLFGGGKAAHLLITGVHPDASEADILRQWKGENALPPCCLTLGYKATTTTQNAEETREFLQDKNFASIRLVTADFHMNRALLEFRHALPGIEIIPNPIRQPDATVDKEWFWVVCFLEYHKTVLRWMALLFTPATPLHGLA